MIDTTTERTVSSQENTSGKQKKKMNIIENYTMNGIKKKKINQFIHPGNYH